MNIFMPEITIQDSVKALDDRRLIKQILECYQIIHINDRVLAGEQKVGYANHPVVKFYRFMRKFLIDYGYYACSEYYFRYNKRHSYDAWFDKEWEDKGTPESLYSVCYIDKRPDLFQTWTLYYPIKDKELSAVHKEFRKKLINKWNSDKYPPRWTNRQPPKWIFPEAAYDYSEGGDYGRI